MTCPEFQTSKYGRTGIGVVQPQSGLDYPLVGFINETLTQKILRRLQHPLNAVLVGGSFALRIQPPGVPPPPPFYISNLSPLWPSETPVEEELRTLNTENIELSVTGSYLQNIEAAISYYSDVYPGSVVGLSAATIELACVDANNLVVGWAEAESYAATCVAGNFPETFRENSFFTRWMAYRQRNCPGGDCAGADDVVDPPWSMPNDDEMRYLIADLHLAYDDAGEYVPAVAPAAHPLRIKYLYGIGCIENKPPEDFPTPVHAADIVVVDANNRVVFDTTTQQTDFNAQPWGNDYHIYEWKTSHGVCRLVIYTTWPDDDNGRKDDDTRRNYTKFLVPTNAQLDERAVYKMPKRLLSMRVRNGQTTTARYKGSFKFVNGYNTELITNPPTIEQRVINTNINFSAEAGTGVGYFPECGDGYDENDVPIPRNIKTINGVAPAPGGDFLLSAGDCLYTRPRLDDNRLDHNKLAVGADCTPCCKCSDYVQTAEYMNSLAALYSVIGDRVQAAKLVHYENIAAFNQKRTCTINNPLKLVIVPQCCPEADVVLMLCNSCQTCYPASELTFKLTTLTIFEPSPGNAVAITPNISVVCGSVTARNPAGTTANNNIDVTNIPHTNGANSKIGAKFTVNLPPVPAGSSAFVKFRMRVNDGYYRTSQFTGELSGSFTGSDAIKTGCPDETPNTGPAVASKVFILNCSNSGVDPRCVN